MKRNWRRFHRPGFPLFVLLCAFSWLSTHDAFAQRPTAPKDPDPARFDSEITAFENWDRQNSAPREAVLFVGSSSIRMWQTAESFPDLPLINRGFGGSHISDVNHFADRIVLKYRPRVIVFYAGDNDIAGGKSPQQVCDDFQGFVQLVRPRIGDTQIVFISIKPSPARWKLWPQAQEANALIAEFSKRDGNLLFVDIAPPMLDSDGEPRRDIFLDDGLHLNPKGYKLWTRILAPILEKSAK
jgi:lysophospholipase L1-like esterase